ncbi:MAG: hypothetical protein JWO80_5723 [Bryobacterales bacterium]|nr:hypothetical protein [Bryobacterales bacterium]
MTQILARALVRTGHNVRVIGVYPTLTSSVREQDSGVEVWRLHGSSRRFGWMPARYRLYRTVAQWARRREIDLVEAPDWEGWAAGWPALPIPVVVRLHGSSSYFAAEMGSLSGRTAFWLERAGLRRSDYCCSVSRYTAEKTRELFKLQMPASAVIYNGVDVPTRSSRGPRSRSKVVFTGTLTAKKGVVPLIRSWPRVKGQCPGAELHLFGKDGLGPANTSMREYLVRELPDDCKGSVVFHGHTGRERVLEELGRARVAVFPSYAEAFAMAPLEAMANGCPTIYSDRGSGRELIRSGIDGLLADPAYPLQIADAIVRVLRDDSLAARLGAAGRERIERSFSSGEMLRVSKDFYSGCVRDFRDRHNGN